MIPLEQDSNRVREARHCGLRQRDAAAAFVGRVRRELNQPVTLHAGEHLCHRRPLDLGEAGEITLRARPAVPKRNQHWQVSNAEAKRLKPGFAQASKPTRRETDQVAWRRKYIEIHRTPPPCTTFKPDTYVHMYLVIP